ncbi:MAG: single-stranded-DNA-specific exonuclease RecJ, partial [Chthonomonadales bacterium]
MSAWRGKRWRIAESEPAAVERLKTELGCSPIVARLLVNRGISDPAVADRFLNPCYSHLPDPFLLPDAAQAAERIKVALHKRERIFVHGDYDGDGITSAALWTRLLEKLGADVQVHVPHRKRDGYDIRSKFVQDASAAGAALIITTDCGIQRIDEVEEARLANIDVVVTDHHEPGEFLPRAVAVVNPHRKDSIYPFYELAGVGVAYRTGEAVVRHLGLSVDSYRRAYCDLAAIGTVTDVMPIVSDNRIFVKYGLESIRTTKKPGLRSLLTASGITAQSLTASSIGFRIGPRINAIGRLDDAKLALDLMLTRDEAEANTLATLLETANRDRQGEQHRIQAEALAQVADIDLEQTYCLVLCGESWNSGVIGIVASKMVEATGRPTVLIAFDREKGVGRGSARSIRPFDMLSGITTCHDLLTEFGGHSHAAGMGILPQNFDEFAKRMNAFAKGVLTPEDFIPELVADAEIKINEATESLINEMSVLEPFGRGNSEPLFIIRGAAVADAFRMGADKQHLKLRLKVEGEMARDAIAWGAGDLADRLNMGDLVDICCKLQMN